MKTLGSHLKKISQQPILDYLVLFTAGIFFLLFLRMSQGERFKSFLAILMFTSFYILWGIYHHSREETLHLKNVLEYIFIGFTILLVSILIFSF